jgi:hypothetical protein
MSVGRGHSFGLSTVVGRTLIAQLRGVIIPQLEQIQFGRVVISNLTLPGNPGSNLILVTEIEIQFVFPDESRKLPRIQLRGNIFLRRLSVASFAIDHPSWGQTAVSPSGSAWRLAPLTTHPWVTIIIIAPYAGTATHCQALPSTANRTAAYCYYAHCTHCAHITALTAKHCYTQALHTAARTAGQPHTITLLRALPYAVYRMHRLTYAVYKAMCRMPYAISFMPYRPQAVCPVQYAVYMLRMPSMPQAVCEAVRMPLAVCRMLYGICKPVWQVRYAVNAVCRMHYM